MDGNKRTALAAAGIFLEMNGHRLVASEQHAVVATLALAAGEIDQVAAAAWLKQELERRSKVA